MQTTPTGWDREFTQTLMNYCYAEVTLHLGDNDTLTFTKADMTSFEVSQSVSPINAELPQSSIRFSITTIDRDVRALQRSLTRMLKVTARVGITINGEPFYINAGTFWLDTWDFPNGGIEASFEARDALYFLSAEKYIYGVYRRNGISLYDLADEVLTYAQGRFPCVTTWSINNILSSIDTTAPLPVCTYAECLQYIAQASGTVLKYDRNGVIRFDLTSGDTAYNYIVTDTNCFAYPQLVMYPELRKLRCNVYTYSLEEIYSDAEHYPNVNGDATVSAVDAALVLTAAAHIGAGEPSGLTPEQEVKADADRDGMITAADAALIQEYAAKCGSGKYENTPDGWALFLNIKIGYKEKVYDSIHNIDEDMELVITYGTSAEVNVMKEGTITITNVDDYSNAAEITITGTDEDAQITAYGFPIEVSTHEYRRDVNESGDDEYIDNPLVTNNTTAGSATQDVKDFLSIRNGVECSDFRIDPRLDAGDTITVNIDGEDTTYGNTIVTDVKYRFTGMFRGSISGRINIPDPEPTPTGQIFGVSWDGGESPVLTRTDAAANFDNPDPYVADGNHPGYSPFDSVMPWAGIERVTIDGNEMVKIPKFWFKVTKTGDAMTFQIADYPAEGFYVSPAHADRGDGVGERDYVYVGRYHCASDYKSKSGVTPIANITRAVARTGCHALGDNYWQFDFAMFWTTRLLYIVEMANFDSQAVIGYGRGNVASAVAMGYTDTMPYHTGTMAANRTTYGANTQYRYMEGLWDNVVDWCDGIGFSGSSVYVHNTPSEYNDSRTNYTLVGTRPTSSNCIKSMFVPTAEGYEYAMYPSEVVSDSSYTKYFADNCFYGSSGVVLCCGGSWDQSRYFGMFCLSGDNSASFSHGSIGARLQYLHG